MDRLCEEDLVHLAQNGSSAAAERLINLYGGSVRRAAGKFFLMGAEPDDLIQEGYIGLIKAIRSFSPVHTQFRFFACVCITRQIQTAVRDAARTKHHSLNSALSYQVAESTGVLDAPIDHTEAVCEVLGKYGAGLTEFERTVLLGLVSGKSYADIAQTLGCPPKSVDNGIQRAKRKIMLNRLD